MTKPATGFLAAFLLLALLSASFSCSQHKRQDIPKNTDILAVVPFALDASSVGLSTSVQGTIFVSGDKQDNRERRIQVIATLEIDPRDWGGVCFYVPGSWDIITATSSYPEGKADPEQYLNFWAVYDTPTPEVPEAVVVGANTDYSGADGGGGRGSLSFEIKYATTGQEPPSIIEFSVAIGGIMDEIHDVPVQGPCYIRLQVPLALDGAPAPALPSYTTHVETTAPGYPPTPIATTRTDS